MDKFKARLDEIQRLADAIDRHKTDLMEAAAYDAGFPVTITSIEVDLSVDHLRTMDKEIPWVENGRSYGTVATIFPYDAPTVVLARLGGSALLTGNTLRFSLSSQTPRNSDGAVWQTKISGSFLSQELRRLGRYTGENTNLSINSFLQDPGECPPPSCLKMRMPLRPRALLPAGRLLTAVNTAQL